jgi:hypothetical protein
MEINKHDNGKFTYIQNHIYRGFSFLSFSTLFWAKSRHNRAIFSLFCYIYVSTLLLISTPNCRLFVVWKIQDGHTIALGLGNNFRGISHAKYPRIHRSINVCGSSILKCLLFVCLCLPLALKKV